MKSALVMKSNPEFEILSKTISKSSKYEISNFKHYVFVRI